MQVRDMMTRDVVTVMAETPLKQVAALLVERRISGVPVVDAAGTVQGVVTEADFLRKESGEESHLRRRGWMDAFASGRAFRRAELERIGARSAEDAMTVPAITIGPDQTLREAAQIMSRNGINRLPVVELGRLVGIISRADILRVFARSDRELRDEVAFAVRAVDGLVVAGVQDGVVSLSGTVQSKALVTTVHSVIAHLDGVVAVDDRNVTWQEQPEAALI